jgi:hypothetical protein
MSRHGAAGGGRGAVLLLALAVAALGYVNWRVVEMEIDIAPAAADVGPAQSFLPPELEPATEPPPLSRFEEIVQRPVFTVARRPLESAEEGTRESAADAAEEAVEAPPPELQLVGIAIDGGTRQALLRRPGEREAWVRQGESFAGWRLESVEADGIVLDSGERSQALTLYPARETAAGP